VFPSVHREAPHL